MAGEGAPDLTTHNVPIAATANGGDAFGLTEAPFAGTIAGVTVTPVTVLTGANTDSRTFKVTNKGAADAGTAIPASKAFVSGVNAVAEEETALTLSATAADLVVAAGDVLEVESLHVGSTGLAGPQAVVRITFSRVSGS
jgi:hypothetical protein